MTRQEAASNLVHNDYFHDFFDELEDMHLNSIGNSRPDDYELREQAYLKLQALREIKAHIESIAQSAEIKQKRWKIL